MKLHRKNKDMLKTHYFRVCEIIRNDNNNFHHLDIIDVIIENFGDIWGKNEHSLYHFLREKKRYFK